MHCPSGKSNDVEDADEVDVDNAFKFVERVRTVAPDDFLAGTDASTRNSDARRSELLHEMSKRCLQRLGRRHVALGEDTTDFRRNCGTTFSISIEHSDSGSE